MSKNELEPAKKHVISLLSLETGKLGKIYSVMLKSNDIDSVNKKHHKEKNVILSNINKFENTLNDNNFLLKINTLLEKTNNTEKSSVNQEIIDVLKHRRTLISHLHERMESLKAEDLEKKIIKTLINIDRNKKDKNGVNFVSYQKEIKKALEYIYEITIYNTIQKLYNFKPEDKNRFYEVYYFDKNKKELNLNRILPENFFKVDSNIFNLINKSFENFYSSKKIENYYGDKSYYVETVFKLQVKNSDFYLIDNYINFYDADIMLEELYEEEERKEKVNKKIIKMILDKKSEIYF